MTFFFPPFTLVSVSLSLCYFRLFFVVQLAVICEEWGSAFPSNLKMNCESILQGEKTNRSAAASDLITETAIPACDNLMTVLHPRHIKNTTFNHRRHLWTSMAQDGTIVLMRTKRCVPQRLHSASLSKLLYCLTPCVLVSLCFCPSNSHITQTLLFINSHIWLPVALFTLPLFNNCHN